MYCRLWEPRIQLWLDDELPVEEAERVSRHLKGCGECRAELEAQRRVSESLKAEHERAEASPGFRERAQARLLDAFAEHLTPPPDSDLQWSLPLLKEEEV